MHAAQQRPPKAPYALVLSLVSLIMVSVANTTATAVAQPSIAAAFDARPADVGAVVFAYLSTYAVATALYGGAARRFGTSRVLAFGAGLLVVGAVGAMLAPSLGFLVAARVLQGVGAGAIPTMSFSIMAERLHGPMRARGLGLHVTGVGIGQTLGPLLGGLLIDYVSWRAAVGIGVLALPGLLLVRWLHPTQGEPGVHIDIAGAAGVAVSVLTGFWLLSRGLASGPVTLRAVAVGAVLVVAFATWRHLARSPRPFLPQSVLTSGSLWRPLMLAACGMASFATVITGLPLALGTGGERVSGVELGLLLLPMAAAVALVSPFNGKVVARIGRSRTTGLSFLVMGTGFVVAAFLAQGGPSLALALVLMPVGAGFGLLNAPLAGEVSTAFEQPERSPALGLYNLGFFVGGATGSALVSALVDTPTGASPEGFRTAVAITLAAIVVAYVTSVVSARRSVAASGR